MDTSTFNRIRKIVYETSGIALNEGKHALVCARLGKRMRALGLHDYRAYLRYLIKDESGEETLRMVDAISTNVTHFFRESRHFELLEEVVGKWLKSGQRRFRFWSAASSTGEEPYSLAMMLLDAFRGREVDLRILATDICTDALTACREGTYLARKMEPVSAARRHRYFTEQKQDDGTGTYTIRNELKNRILFKRLNLSTPPFPMSGPFDAIFCRNVMIYFDNTVRKRLLTEVYRLLKPGGFLLVGHAESLTGIVSDFKVVEPSVYLKP